MLTDLANEKVFWTRKMNIKLVKFMENHPNIWNPKHPKYTSIQCRDKTYAQFASKYGNAFTGEAVKHRWTNIRSTFANYLRKFNANRANGDAEDYKISWHLWEPCQFLLKVNKSVQNDTTGEKESISDNKDWSSDHGIHTEQTDNTDSMCTKIAENLVSLLEGVQNDCFSVESNKNSRVGQAVCEKLSQMSPYEANKASRNIIDILLLYEQDTINLKCNKESD